jgi:hypothetical protein
MGTIQSVGALDYNSAHKPNTPSAGTPVKSQVFFIVSSLRVEDKPCIAVQDTVIILQFQHVHKPPCRDNHYQQGMLSIH